MMREQGRPFDAALEVLLERGREIPPAPDVVRARALARARATVAASAASITASEIPARGRGLRIALAASVALAIGAAGATAALLGPMPHQPEPPPPSSPRVVPPAPAAPPEAPPSGIAAKATSIAKPQRPARPATAQESYKAEVALLQRAQAAYTRRGFLDALVLVAEHGRLFPNGRLAEQREALRVRSLAGAGRTDDAHHAIIAFARRFPRSVLLQRLQETAQAAE